MAKKTPKKKAEQLKIEGTGRKDAIPELDKAADAYRDARDARMEMQEDESSAQEFLTNLLKKHGLRDYPYEGKDGKQYKATLDEPKAKVKRVTDPAKKKASE